MIEMFSNYPDVMTVKQVKEALQIGRNSAYSIVSSGKLKSLKIGRSFRVPKIYLLDYVQNLYETLPVKQASSF